jgi:integrase
VRTARKWYIELTDHLQIVRRFAGFEDKRQTEALGRQIERLIYCRAAGEQPDIQLSQWLERTPPSLRKRFVEIDLLDKTRAEAGKSLMQHLKDFKVSLEDKGNTAMYVKTMTTRIKRIIVGCAFTVWSDIQADRVQHYLANLRNGKKHLSVQTTNHYLQSMKEFCRWLVQNRRATDSPLVALGRMNVAVDRRHDRTAFEIEEVQRLLAAAYKGPERYGMSGPERALLYRLTVETGLRRSELKNLKVSSFDFGKGVVVVAAVSSKHRREDTLPLRTETMEELKAFFTGKLPSAKAFGGRYKRLTDKTALMIQEDLAATAETDSSGNVTKDAISYTDSAGRFRDFHALRHTCGSWLAAMGVHPKTIQTIMRHGDINLTMSRYSHALKNQTAEAVERLPSLPICGPQTQKATGTDGKGIVLADCLADSGAQSFTNMHQSTPNTPSGAIESRDSTANGGIRTHNPWFTKPELYH